MRIPYHNKTRADTIYSSFVKYFDQPVTAKQLVKHIKSFAGSETVITLESDISLNENSLLLNAFYETDTFKNPLEVTIKYNSNFKELNLKQQDWKNFLEKLIEYLDHEMIDNSQYNNYSKNKKLYINYKSETKSEIKKFFGNSIELENFSNKLHHDILKTTRNDYKQSLRILANFIKFSITEAQAKNFFSNDVVEYFQYFNFDVKNTVLKNILRESYKKTQTEYKKQLRKSRINQRNSHIATETEKFIDRKNAIDKDTESDYIEIIEKD
jgi:hypothetical protein